MSTIDGTFDVSAFIDAQPVRGRQYVVTVLCGLVMFLDGLDTQSISYAAPLIAKEWTLPHQVLGLIFSSALAGLIVGYLFISPLSDRFGHRRIMIVSTIAFGLLTALNALTTNVTQLLVLRFLTGLGLSAAAPSAVALTSEYNPKRLRATFVLLIYCGFSLGFVAAGGLAAWLLPSLGWRSLFWIGAAAPLIISVFLVS
jgi:MFS transporter, AAHS family, 4-hydroxybenzoate transporter